MDDGVNHKLREIWRETVFIKDQAEAQTILLRDILQRLQKNDSPNENANSTIFKNSISRQISEISSFIGCISLVLLILLALITYWMHHMGVF